MPLEPACLLHETYSVNTVDVVEPMFMRVPKGTCNFYGVMINWIQIVRTDLPLDIVPFLHKSIHCNIYTLYHGIVYYVALQCIDLPHPCYLQ
jgi:hypothetical protein